MLTSLPIKTEDVELVSKTEGIGAQWVIAVANISANKPMSKQQKQIEMRTFWNSWRTREDTQEVRRKVARPTPKPSTPMSLYSEIVDKTVICENVAKKWKIKFYPGLWKCHIVDQKKTLKKRNSRTNKNRTWWNV